MFVHAYTIIKQVVPEHLKKTILVAFKIYWQSTRLCNQTSFKLVSSDSMLTHTNRKETRKLILPYCLNKGAQYYLQRGHKSILNVHKCYFVCMTNTDGKRKEMQTWCQQRSNSLKRWPPQLLLLYLGNEHLAE